ncbi:hypothetical protein K470DRAFT_9068 [Piedraia hortae CBS 480.64]|uniref:Uncharacterized protein n=1 Tax=Piedraia hortae CBS 480.64 TaxID=1314780 RepID=A0A6A7C5N5_9PEZI|nr:hypothetical protein K470DRAFT_9068 [Piedraia hortae CBS 480.64]
MMRQAHEMIIRDLRVMLCRSPRSDLQVMTHIPEQGSSTRKFSCVALDTRIYGHTYEVPLLIRTGYVTLGDILMNRVKHVERYWKQGEEEM